MNHNRRYRAYYFFCQATPEITIVDKSKSGYIIKLQGITAKDTGDRMNIFEKIFHGKELRFLRNQNKELKKTNDEALSGDSVNLTSKERRVILDALIDPAYEEKISDPKVSFEIRQTYKRAKEKIAMVEAYHRKKNEGSG